MHTNRHEFLHSAIRTDSCRFVDKISSGDRVGSPLAGDWFLGIASKLASYNLHRHDLGYPPTQAIPQDSHHGITNTPRRVVPTMICAAISGRPP